MEVRAVREELVELEEEAEPAESLRNMSDATSPSSLGDERRCRLRGEVRLKNDRKSPFGAGGFVGVFRSRKTLPTSPFSAVTGVVGGVESISPLAVFPFLDPSSPDIIGEENVSATAAVQSSPALDSSRDFRRGGDEPYVEEEEAEVR